MVGSKKIQMFLGHVLQWKLKGIPCTSLEIYQEKGKIVGVSRSFGRKVTKLEELDEAITTHCLNAAEKIRSDNQTTKTNNCFYKNKSFSKG